MDQTEVLREVASCKLVVSAVVLGFGGDFLCCDD